MECIQKVLAIEASYDDLSRIQQCLGAEGQVHAAATLDEGLRWLQAEQAFSIVLDVEGSQLPLEVIHQLQAAAPAARVILLSRLADERLWIEALEAGAYDLLRQPLGGMEAAGVVRSALLPGAAAVAA